MWNRTLVLIALLVLALLPDMAAAEQYTIQGADGRTHVAHTRLAPVIMHRAFPPYWGVHVYQRPSRRTGR